MGKWKGKVVVLFLLVFGFSGLSLGVGEMAAEDNVASSGERTMPPTDRNCGEKPCGDCGCSNCTPIEVFLPLGANVKSVLLYSAAVGQSNLQGPNAPCADIQWASWYPHNVYNTPNNTVVKVLFKNWSHNQHRKVRVDVVWTLPH
jgi:hypothetical protein